VDNGNGNGDAPQANQTVQVSPTPTTVAVGNAKTLDGQEWIMLQFATASGTAVFFLNKEGALRTAEEITKHVNAGPTLVTPQNGLVLP
jgi:hypothetical protein